MDALVGYTGFVGSNIAAGRAFGGLYNSKNIGEAFGAEPDLLVYAGVPGEMYLANANPAADRAAVENAAENIRRIRPKRLTLISTSAVLNSAAGADEDYLIDPEKLSAYGLHRYELEKLARSLAPSYHIFRLPALFGMNIKKNFIYDINHSCPSALSGDKYESFSAAEPVISECYEPKGNGFYKLAAPETKMRGLKEAFERIGFSALSFTDSRSVYQFYNLKRLWGHIAVAIENEIPLLHLAVEPLSAGEVYKAATGREFVNEILEKPIHCDFRTKHAALFGGAGGYIHARARVLAELIEFIGGAR